MAIMENTRRIRWAVSIAIAGLVMGGIPQRAIAADRTFSFLSGTHAASALFSLTGTTLDVTLTNTSAFDVLEPTDVLTGLFFDTSSATGHTLTPVSASLNGSTAFYASLSNVGDGWGYASGVSANGKNSAISGTGAVNG